MPRAALCARGAACCAAQSVLTRSLCLLLPSRAALLTVTRLAPVEPVGSKVPSVASTTWVARVAAAVPQTPRPKAIRMQPNVPW